MKEFEIWAKRLLEIAGEINTPRGSLDAPSRYTLDYLFGYIESVRSLLDEPNP